MTKRLLSLFIVSSLVAGLSFVIANSPTASGVTASDWQAGNIINDTLFYDGNAMNVVEIQNFLNSLVPTCDTWGVKPHETVAGKTRAQAGAQYGNPPPYICLKDYYENPTTKETNFNPSATIPTGAVSAAQIIHDAAKEYNINPRVLLVTIKKEAANNLMEDDWPWKGQYRSALGYGCPDTAACDSQYYGFYNQVRNAARQFRLYANYPDSYRRKAGVTQSIQYHPFNSCASPDVYIQNKATAGLYNYTPYQPNAAALANMPGTGDSCSSYGNRNFWYVWNKWFGSTGSDIYIDTFKAIQDIQLLYSQQTPQLGAPVGDVIPEYNAVPRVWQSFENGVVIWTTRYGAKFIPYNSTYTRWRELGGSMGNLGVPTSSAVFESDDGRIWQYFQKGLIIYTPENGGWEILPGPIGDKWSSLGGSTGILARPISSVFINNNGYRQQIFEGGIVIRKDISSPAYAVISAINNSWTASRQDLGFPTSDTLIESGGHTWQRFDKGLIIQIPSTSKAWPIIYGELYIKWQELGGSFGKLGRPASNQVSEPDGRIWQFYEKGLIVQKSKNIRSYEILFGPIYDRWQQTGGSTGTLGVPCGSSFTESDGRSWQYFEKGVIIQSQATDAWEVEGNFYGYWKERGGSLGSLGKPTGEKNIEHDGTRWQNFEKGKVVWRPNSGWSTE